MSDTKKHRRTKVTCKGYCGLKFYKDELTEHNKKLYCSNCLEKQKNEDYYKFLLYDYIKICFNVYRISKWHLTQIKKAIEDGYTYKELYYGLKYAKEYLNIEFNSQSGLGYAINNIDNAILFYGELEKRQIEINKTWVNDKILTPITININDSKNTKNQYLESQIVDLEELFNEQ